MRNLLLKLGIDEPAPVLPDAGAAAGGNRPPTGGGGSDMIARYTESLSPIRYVIKCDDDGNTRI